MTISSTEPRLTFAGNGSTDTFAITFSFDTDTDLKVEVITDSTHDVVAQVLNTDYTVSGTDVVFTTPPASGETVVVTLGLTFSQATDYVANDPFPAETHEDALDELSKQIKELKEDIDYRCFKLPTNNLSSTTVTDTDIGASKVLRINAAGTGIELATVNSITNGGDSWSDSVNSDIIPDTDNTYDLGSATYRFTDVRGVNLYGTLQTAAQTNITSLGTLTSVTIDNVTINGNDISTGSGDLTFTPTGVCDFSANTDHMVIPVGTTAQRDTSDGAGSLRWNSTDGRLEAYTGSAWVQYTSAGGPGAWSDPIDSSITVDTDSAYDLGANAARLANGYFDTLYGALATAAQPNVTSLGTLTTLTVDNITINGNDISSGSGNITLTPTGYVDMSPSTSFFLPPKGTTAQRTESTAGELRYNTTTNKLEYYNGTSTVALEAAAGGGMTLLATGTASASATVDFDNAIDSTYETYRLYFSGIIPATDGSVPALRIGTGATPTYQSGASDYMWTCGIVGDTGSAADYVDAAAAEIRMLGGSYTIGNATGEGFSGYVDIYSPSNTSLHTLVSFQMIGLSTATAMRASYGGGKYSATTAVTSLRFLMTSGNITSGEFKLYGLQKST